MAVWLKKIIKKRETEMHKNPEQILYERTSEFVLL